MGITVSRVELLRQVREAVAIVGSSPLMVHTDVARLGVPDNVKNTESFLQEYHDIFRSMAESRTILVPTFNYDYCTSRLFDVDNDPSQVGRFTEYLRQTELPRTETPIFNFVIFNNHDFPLQASPNPFGAQSTFQHLLDSDGSVCFFGSQFLYNTFIHFVEEALPVSYRYHKPFPGKVRTASREYQVDFVYRVRPLTEGAVEYDWVRLEDELRDQGILKRFQVGHGFLLIYRCSELYSFWLDQLKTDELYLLSEESRSKIGLLFDLHGHPLTFESVEG